MGERFEAHGLSELPRGPSASFVAYAPNSAQDDGRSLLADDLDEDAFGQPLISEDMNDAVTSEAAQHGT